MKVLLALDKFKGSMTASGACAQVQEALWASDPGVTIVCTPLTDGGEGFCEIVTQALGGGIREFPVTWPDMRRGHAKLGLVDQGRISPALIPRLGLSGTGLLAILEMAEASGFHLVDANTRDPWQYTTLGVGDLLHQAWNVGATEVLLGLGGSATNDMGIGVLEAFGLEGLDAAGKRVSPMIPAAWNGIASFRAPENLPPLTLHIAGDVHNPLHGPLGAAAVFGPQKGLMNEDLATMQASMERITELMMQAFPDQGLDPNTPGFGAAGGLAFGLSLAWRTHIHAGFEVVSDVLSLDSQIASSDLVITGEGSLDASSLGGKGPVGVIRRAWQAGKQVHVFAGKVDPATAASLVMDCPGLQIHEIGNTELSLQENLKRGNEHLQGAVRRVFSERTNLP
jgi:glycerate 2-kinase